MRTAAVTFFFVFLASAISCYNPGDTRPAVKSSLVKSTVSKAERFSIEKNDSCTILTISDPWQGAEDIRNVYYLVGRERISSVKADPSRIIPVPVEKIICMSSTHIAMVTALGEQESIAGISGLKYVYDDTIRLKADSDLILEVGFDSEINDEVILKTNPDLIMMYGIGVESAGYVGKIIAIGD